MQIYRILVIGWTYDIPILFDANSIRVIDGNGNLLALGYVNVFSNGGDTSIKIFLPPTWENGTYGHIHGTFSYFL